MSFHAEKSWECDHCGKRLGAFEAAVDVRFGLSEENYCSKDCFRRQYAVRVETLWEWWKRVVTRG